MIRPQLILDLNAELIVDNFAGGGGASAGIELALGRHVDIAVNHDALAVALHSANHPQTEHLCEDVFKVHPRAVTRGRPVGVAWFSPDCKDFSKAKGGKPRSKKIRGLAWVAVKWADTARPRVIFLENVEEFQDWGPLLKDNTRCPKRIGKTFKNFVGRLRKLGYEVQWKEIRACDYGAPTIRKRLYLIARCDGKPIVWPAPTHADPKSQGFRASGLRPWRTAAECIDWALPCPSIFLTREEAKVLGVKRPLAEATMRRLYRGVRKFVLEAKEPFIVEYHSGKHPMDHRVRPVTAPLATQTTENRFGLAVPFVAPLTHQGSDRVEGIQHPFRTITGANRGEKAVALPFLTEHANSSNQRNPAVDEPLRTLCAETKGGHFALVQAFLAKHYGGVIGSKADRPIGTITSVDHHSLVAAHLGKWRGQSEGTDATQPLPTITAGSSAKHPGGNGHALGVVASHLSKFYGTNTGQRTDGSLHSITSQGQHLAEVRAFLTKYYGAENEAGAALRRPAPTIVSKDRLGLVAVQGVDYQISDIGMRMLAARELYRGQGFPESYIIEIMVDVMNKRGKWARKRLSNEAQVRMCGNSVCPPVAEALVAANVPELAVWRNGERKAFEKRVAALRGEVGKIG